ncbi:Serine/threonine-phosphatase 7 long form-like protein [Nymphaea thermarum]|nr:Serine/threonine-phosphatase 7 long form-like protein [Nymphaea thermarum]
MAIPHPHAEPKMDSCVVALSTAMAALDVKLQAVIEVRDNDAKLLQPTAPEAEGPSALMGMPLLEDELKTGRVKWAPRFRQPGAAKLLPELSTWFHRLEPQFGEGWRKVGIYGALKASLGEIKRQKDVLLALIELWSWETNTFVFPWGEMTVTLEDLAIMGLPLFGKLACDRTWDASDRRAVAENELEIRRKTKFPSSAKVTYAAWIREWMGGEAEPPTMRENQAFLALWLCRSVLPSSSGEVVRYGVFPMAVDLSLGHPIALAPALLSILYEGFGRIATSKEPGRANCYLPLHFLQVWVWEHFPHFAPNDGFKFEKDDIPMCRWLGKTIQNVSMVQARERFRSDEPVEWRPYTKAKGQLPKWLVVEEDRWVRSQAELSAEYKGFLRCICTGKIVGAGIVQSYHPHRVARQFGLDQGVPQWHASASHGKLGDKVVEEAFLEYCSLCEETPDFLIPSTSRVGSMTKVCAEWWLRQLAMVPTRSQPFPESIIHNAGSSDEENDSPSECLSFEVKRYAKQKPLFCSPVAALPPAKLPSSRKKKRLECSWQDESDDDDCWEQGIQLRIEGAQLMLRGFVKFVASAHMDQLPRIVAKGNEVLECLVSTGLSDPGVDALLRSLCQQADEAAEQRTILSNCSVEETSCTGEMKSAAGYLSKAEFEVFRLRKIEPDLFEEVEEGEAEVQKAKEVEEAARRVRVQAEEEVARRRKQLTEHKAMLEETECVVREQTEAWSRAEKRLVDVKGEANKASQLLATAEATWSRLCREAHTLKYANLHPTL